MTPLGFLSYPYVLAPSSAKLASRSVFAVKGVAMYMRRTAIQEVGFFDDTAFAYFEETDWCWRARLAGWSVEFSTELPIVYHVGGASSSRLASSLIEFHSFKNRMRSIVKNSSLKTLLAMLPLHLLFCLGLAIGAVLTGRATGAKNIGRSMLWNAKVLPETLRQRKAIQCLRRRPDREVFRGVLRGANPTEIVFLASSYQRRQKEIAIAEKQLDAVHGTNLVG